MHRRPYIPNFKALRLLIKKFYKSILENRNENRNAGFFAAPRPRIYFYHAAVAWRFGFGKFEKGSDPWLSGSVGILLHFPNLTGDLKKIYGFYIRCFDPCFSGSVGILLHFCVAHDEIFPKMAFWSC